MGLQLDAAQSLWGCYFLLFEGNTYRNKMSDWIVARTGLDCLLPPYFSFVPQPNSNCNPISIFPQNQGTQLLVLVGVIFRFS